MNWIEGEGDLIGFVLKCLFGIFKIIFFIRRCLNFINIKLILLGFIMKNMILVKLNKI